MSSVVEEEEKEEDEEGGQQHFLLLTPSSPPFLPLTRVYFCKRKTAVIDVRMKNLVDNEKDAVVSLSVSVTSGRRRIKCEINPWV